MADAAAATAPGNSFKAILDKKEQLKSAMEETNVGTKAQKVVEKKREADAPPDAKDPDAPTKYNTPRKPSESLDDYGTRLDALVKAHKAGE